MSPIEDDDVPKERGGRRRPAPRGRGDGGTGGGDNDSWHVEDEGPDDRDLVPDEMTMIRCAQCKKLIFEDSVACPYCRHMQMAEDQNKKPIWFVATVVFCILAVSGLGVLWWLGLLGR